MNYYAGRPVRPSLGRVADKRPDRATTDGQMIGRQAGRQADRQTLKQMNVGKKKKKKKAVRQRLASVLPEKQARG